MSEGIRIPLPAGPYTLRIDFALTKDGREDAGNLLSTKTWSRKFDTIEQALAFLNAALAKVPS